MNFDVLRYCYHQYQSSHTYFNHSPNSSSCARVSKDGVMFQTKTFRYLHQYPPGMSIVSRQGTRMSTIDIKLFGSSLVMYHVHCGYCVVEVNAVVYILHISCKFEDIIEFGVSMFKTEEKVLCVLNNKDRF